MVPLKYLSNFWRTLEIPLINCEISLQLRWSRNCIILAGTINNQNPTIQINVVTLSTRENIKLLKQLEYGFKRTINWKKYLTKTSNQTRNRYIDYLIDPSFQGVNRLFVLSFKDDDGRESHKQYYLLTVKIKDCNVMEDKRDFFDQPIKNDLKNYDNIREISTGQGDDHATDCLLGYPYFKKYCKLIGIDLSKQQKLHANTKAIQQINFTGNLDRAKVQQCFIIEEAKETVLVFSKGTVKLLWFSFCFNIILI